MRALAAAAASAAAGGGAGGAVGFVGLGAMGAPMARALARAGGASWDTVVACDMSPAAFERVEGAGGAEGCPVEWAASPRALAERGDVRAVVTMLPAAAHVLETVKGPEGLLSAGGAPPPLLVDCSSTGPACAREVAAAMQARGGAFADAPVSGGVPGAEAASLTFMVGGSEADFGGGLLPELLGAMGKKAVRCGGVGAGQSTKLCNNHVLGIHMAAVAEGLALGKRLGLDPKVLSEVFNTSSARCWSSDSYNPVPGVMEGVPAARGYRNGFLTDLMVKDMRLAGLAAEEAGAPLPVGEPVLALYEALQEEGHGREDFGSIYKHVYASGGGE